MRSILYSSGISLNLQYANAGIADTCACPVEFFRKLFPDLSHNSPFRYPLIEIQTWINANVKLYLELFECAVHLREPIETIPPRNDILDIWHISHLIYSSVFEAYIPKVEKNNTKRKPKTNPGLQAARLDYTAWFYFQTLQIYSFLVYHRFI